MTILEVEQLTKICNNEKMAQEVLQDISMSIEEGELITTMGPSGSGKAALLNILSPIDYISQGSITLKGHELEKLSNKALFDIRKHDIGLVFQEHNLLHTLTVKENIMLPLTVQRLDRDTILDRYEEVAEALNILDISDKYPSELPGGQRQRTSAARAFITLPSIIFADEPASALDSKGTQDLLKRLMKINEEIKTAVIMVTHDPVTASYANRVVMLKDEQIFTGLYRGGDNKHTFFKEIIRVQSVLGGVNYEF